MKCGGCGKRRAVYEARDFRYIYGGREVTIPALKAQYCPDCGEILMEVDQAGRYGDAVVQLWKEVNSSIVDPAFITSAREKLELSQEQAAELFGQPRRSFFRYESALRPVPVPLVQLLVIFGNHPELIAEISSVKYPNLPSEDEETEVLVRGFRF